MWWTFPKGGFTPNQLSGLQIWTRSDLGVTTIGGVVQSPWVDQSGNGNNLTVFGSPAYNASDFLYGNKPSIDLNGSTARFASPNLADLGVYTAFIVARNTKGTGYWLSNGWGDYTYSDIGFSLYTPSRGGGATSGWNDSFDWGASPAPRLLTREMDGTHVGDTLRLDTFPVTLVNQAAGNPGTDTGVGQVFFSSYTDGSATMSGSIAEIIYYNRALTPTEVSQVETYLVARYGSFFDPADITGLTGWYRADAGITLNGSAVATWSDFSHALLAPDFGQDTSAAQPSWTASGINGLPDVVFNNIFGQYLSGSTSIYSTNSGVTLFGIFQTATNSTPQFIWGMEHDSAHYAVLMNSGSANPGKLDFIPFVDSNKVTSPARYDDSLPHCFIATYDRSTGATQLFVDNGVTPAASATGTAGLITNTTNDKNSMGAAVGPSAHNLNYSGHLPEIGAYNNPIGASDVQNLMTYLKKRAGI